MEIPQRTAPEIEALKSFYVGKNIASVPKPALILDAAGVRRNCRGVLDAIDALGVGFRAHVKSHKTTEIARLQVGDGSGDVKFVVSTIAEIEHLVPLLLDFQNDGRRVDVLYGIPLPPSQVQRLARLARKLGPTTLSVLIDHPSHLQLATEFYEAVGSPLGVFIKVDTGYHRAGLPPQKLNKDGLLDKVRAYEAAGQVSLLGLYSHSSLSYNYSTQKEIMAILAEEIEGCLEALQYSVGSAPQSRDFIISVGASPQILAMADVADCPEAELHNSQDWGRLRLAIEQVGNSGGPGSRFQLELHAGVYTFLDMQQLSTNARAWKGSVEDHITVSVVAEVCSVYNEGERRRPEALIAVGTLGLGREPCQSYQGWAVVGRPVGKMRAGSDQARRLVVERISQEHSIVSWELSPEEESADVVDLPPIPLEVGQTVRVYPNHACVTSAMYGWYLVIDEKDDEAKSKITDVWVRACRW